MKKNAHFGKFKQPHLIRVSTRTKIQHVFKDKWNQLIKWQKLKLATSKTVDTMGALSTASSIAVLAGVTGGFVALTAGVPVAIGLGAIGLWQAGKGAYSDREAKHVLLTPYLWSYIDDEPPKSITKINVVEIGEAALYLMIEGQTQMKRQESKLEKAVTDWNKFWFDYGEISQFHEKYPKEFEVKETLAGVYVNEIARRKHLEALDSNPNDKRVLTYMRRLIHLGNYLQMYPLLATLYAEDYKSLLPDFALKRPQVGKARDALAKLSSMITKHDRAYESVVIRMRGNWSLGVKERSWQRLPKIPKT